MNLSTFDLFRSIDSDAAGLITLNQGQLDSLQAVLLSVADDIMSVCEEHSFTCLLSGGTALGAWREGKFIPWDDDLDLMMPRADYNRFIPLFREKYSGEYWIHTPEETNNYGFQVCHIRKKGTKVKTKSDLSNDAEAGANIDIFIIENVPDHAVLRKMHGFLCMFMGLMLSSRRFFRDRKELLKIVAYSPEMKKTFRTKVFLGGLSAVLSVNTWTRLTNKVCSLCKNNSSKYVSIPGGRKHYFGEMYLRKDFCETCPVQFEGRTWHIPRDVESYFRVLYGDGFRTPPPPEKREKHICWEFDLGEHERR